MAAPSWPASLSIDSSEDSTLLTALGPDLSLAMAQHGSTQIWVVNQESEFDLVEICGPISALVWATADLLCAGFESGEVVCLPRPKNGSDGQKWFRGHFHDKAVASLRVSRVSADGLIVNADSLWCAPLDCSLWIVYADRVVVSTSIGDIDPRKPLQTAEGSQGSTALPPHERCALSPFPSSDTQSHGISDDSQVNDVVACGAPSVSLFGRVASTSGGSSAHSITLLVCSHAPHPLTFYHLGDLPGQPRGFRRIARQAAHALKVTAVNFLSGFMGGLLAADNSESSGGQAQQSPDKKKDTTEPLNGVSGIRDDRRSITQVWLDPTLTHALASDQLGRVLLIDTTQQLVVRMWKGMRDAQCGWLQESGKLFMLLYAPRRGFVDIFAAFHGTLVHSFSVGTGARLVTTQVVSESGPQHVRCVTCIIRETRGASSSGFEMLSLSAAGPFVGFENERKIKNTESLPLPINSSPPKASCAQTSPVDLEAPSPLRVVTHRRADTMAEIDDVERAQVFESDLDTVQSLAAMSNADYPEMVTLDDVFVLLRRLRTASGVMDAFKIILDLPSMSNASSTRSLEFLQDAISWASDANTSGLLLFSTSASTKPQDQTVLKATDDTDERHLNEILESFLERRLALIDSYRELSSLALNLTEQIRDASDAPLVTPATGKWVSDLWQREATAWLNLSDKEELSNIEFNLVPVNIFLSYLEDGTENYDLLADLLFAPLLFDVFCCSAICRCLKTIGPLIAERSGVLIQIGSLKSSNFLSETLSNSLLESSSSWWIPTLSALFGRWLMQLPPSLLRRTVLSTASASNGVIRLMENFSFPFTFEGGEETISSLLPWLRSCREEQHHHGNAFVLAVVAREVHFRLLKVAESKTYGNLVANDVIRGTWDSLLTQLRLLLLFTSRRRALNLALFQASGCLEESKNDILGPLPITLSAATLHQGEENENNEESAIKSTSENTLINKGKLLQIAVWDTTALDILSALEGNIDICKYISFIEHSSIPDPRICDNHSGCMWPDLAFGHIVNCAKEFPVLNKFRQPSSRINLFELFAFNPYDQNEMSSADKYSGTSSAPRLSRLVLHNHAALLLSQSWTNSFPLEGSTSMPCVLNANGLEIIDHSMLLELAVAHLRAAQFPCQFPRRAPPLECIESAALPIDASQTTWADRFFDYDIPSSQSTVSASEGGATPHPALCILTACTAKYIYDKLLYPYVIESFLTSQEDPDFSKSILNDFKLAISSKDKEPHDRDRILVNRFCESACSLLDLTPAITDDKLQLDAVTALQQIQNALNATPEAQDSLAVAAADEAAEDEPSEIVASTTTAKCEDVILTEIRETSGDHFLACLTTSSTETTPVAPAVRAHICVLRAVVAILQTQQESALQLPPLFGNLKPPSWHHLEAPLELRPPSGATSDGDEADVEILQCFLQSLCVAAVAPPKYSTKKRQQSEWANSDLDEQTTKLATIAAFAKALSGTPVAGSDVDWAAEFEAIVVLAQLCAGGQDDGALDRFVRVPLSASETLRQGVLFVCGARIAATLEALERDRSGQLGPLLAALDAGACMEVADGTQARKCQSALLASAQVCMDTVSHDGTLAILEHAAQSPHFRPDAHESSSGVTDHSEEAASGGEEEMDEDPQMSAHKPQQLPGHAQEADDMRELLSAILQVRLGSPLHVHLRYLALFCPIEWSNIWLLLLSFCAHRVFAASLDHPLRAHGPLLLPNRDNINTAAFHVFCCMKMVLFLMMREKLVI